MRKETFTEGEYYHIYNRGVEKRNIFIAEKDYWRFIASLLLFQGKVPVSQISRIVNDVQNLELDKDIFKEVLKSRIVELVCFCLMPNHFHFILKEIKEGGISKFMMRLADSYTKFFNTKYERTGHLFSGVFQSVHIDINKYLLYLSSYIHLNPSELRAWYGREIEYSWSSFQDFTGENRWGDFLNTPIILEQFKSKKEYNRFVKEADIKTELDPFYTIELLSNP